MYEIPNFPDYLLADCKSKVIRKKNNTEVTLQMRRGSKGHFKLKNALNKWQEISLSKILALIFPASIPEGFIQIPKYPGYFVNSQGEVWSAPSKPHPQGNMLTIQFQENKYPTVSIANTTVAGHILLALTFLDPNYLESGYCVMHLDDNKHNFSLSNLKIGTYSENNTAAYAAGLNPGNGMKKN